MAITRKVCDQIGGFEAFASLLAEDQAIALAVRSAGLRWKLSLRIVRNVIVTRTLRQALARQIRWAKIRYSFSKITYIAEFLVNPLPLAILAACASAALASAAFPSTLALTASVSLLRWLETRILSRSTGVAISSAYLLLAPLQDILQFGTQFTAFFSKEVNWRDHRTRLGRGTVMLPSRHIVTDGKRFPSDAGLKWGRLP
jgi:ceramide glucosyltransferase